jgi:hypothetical protein
LVLLDVDEFLRAYAYPQLKTAGLRRKGRELSVAGPDGRIGFVTFRSYNLPEAPGFYCAYGLVTPAHMAWWEERSGPLSSAPLLGSALVMVQVIAPDPDRALASAGRDDWWGLYRDSDEAELGRKFEEALEARVIPDLQSWFDPKVFADDIARRRDDVIPLMNPWPRAEAMALLDVEASEDRLERTLALLPPDDMVRVWIEDRIAKGRSPAD